jgi:hypothetical protein
MSSAAYFGCDVHGFSFLHTFVTLKMRIDGSLFKEDTRTNQTKIELSAHDVDQRSNSNCDL